MKGAQYSGSPSSPTRRSTMPTIPITGRTPNRRSTASIPHVHSGRGTIWTNRPRPLDIG
jgi:hypothetical protein